MTKIVQDVVLSVIEHLLKMPNFRGSVIFIFDIDASTGSVKAKTRVMPLLEIS
jgi:hypothetical protein